MEVSIYLRGVLKRERSRLLVLPRCTLCSRIRTNNADPRRADPSRLAELFRATNR